jgi:hypothetical protein
MTRAPQPPVTEKLVKNIFNDLIGILDHILVDGKIALWTIVLKIIL